MNTFVAEETLRIVRCLDADTPDTYVTGEIIVIINGPFASASVRCLTCHAIRRYSDTTEDNACGSSETLRGKILFWFDGHTCSDGKWPRSHAEK